MGMGWDGGWARQRGKFKLEDEIQAPQSGMLVMHKEIRRVSWGREGNEGGGGLLFWTGE